MLTKTGEEPTLDVLDRISSEFIGEKLSAKGLTAEDIRLALDPVSNVEKRKIIGGPAPSRIIIDIADKKERLAGLSDQIDQLHEGVSTSLRELLDEASSE